jgi:DNA-directed RNA polymerase subunit omega
MARVTIEDCLEQVPNRFSLIHLAFQRVKQLRSGASPTVQSKNKEVVVALREIAAGNVTYPFEHDLKLGAGEIIAEPPRNDGEPALAQP